MRVIRCPNCDEPLPGFANFCSACGDGLIASPNSSTSKLAYSSSSVKMPRFLAVGARSEETILFGEISSAETPNAGQRTPHTSPNNTVPIAQASVDLLESFENHRQKTNWHKIVDSRPSRNTPPRTPALTLRTPLALPLELPPLLPPKEPQRSTPPAFFFWVSMLLLAAIVGGGLFGVAVTLGRGIFAQTPPHHNEIALQVTPSSVALGALVTLRGTNFSPHAHVGLTRDGTVPIMDTGNNDLIQSDGKGFFTDTIIVGPDWQAGPHVIHAEDAILHKIAAFTILVTGHSPSLRPAHLLVSTNTIDLGSGDQATNSIKMVTLTNAGGGQISWQSTATEPWLMLSPKTGTFSSGQSIQVAVAADRSNLKPGNYGSQVIFTSNAGEVSLPVKMKTTLLQPGHDPVLQLTPPVLSFIGTDGGLNPPGQVITVSNPGALPLQWSAAISGGNGWLMASPQTGNVPKGSSQAVVIGVNTSTQLPGVYSGVITFTGQGPGPVRDSPQSVFVSLTITPQCALQVSPGNLGFTGVYQQAGPAAKIIGLADGPGCSLPIRWNAITTTNNGGQWLNVSNRSGTTPSYPSVSANPTGLRPGVYTGSLIFSSAVITQTLPVTFVIAQPSTPIMNTTSATMSFSDAIGQANPSGQNITITNTGGGTLKWNVATATNFGGSWLSVSPASGTLSGYQSTSVNVAVALLSGLTPNTYTGMITITGSNSTGQAAPGSPQNIPVNFAVLPPCNIAAASTALNFTGVIGQPNPAAKAATITASGTCTHPLNWTATSNASWITRAPASGSVSLSSSSTTNIGVSLSGLSANTYTGQVTITAVDSATNQAVGTPQTITVTLTVQPPCTLQSPSVTGETFNSEAGTNPPSKKFTIGISGACTGNVTLTPTVTQSWLSVTPASATLASGGSRTFTVTVTSAALVPGKYTGSISIAAVDGAGMASVNSPQTVNVTLNVYAAPALTVSPGGLTFNVTSGTTSQPISIGNTGGAPLNWTAALASGTPSFVSLSAGSGSNLRGGANTTVNVIVNATGLTGGTTYTTSVTVSAFDPRTGAVVAGSPVTVGFTINIASAAMQLSTTTLNFSTTVGVNPAAQSVILTNTGGNGLTWTAGTPSQSWLTLGLVNGNNVSGEGSTIPFNVNVSGLASGTYTATEVITPSVGNPQTVTVTLTVN